MLDPLGKEEHMRVLGDEIDQLVAAKHEILSRVKKKNKNKEKFSVFSKL